MRLWGVVLLVELSCSTFLGSGDNQTPEIDGGEGAVDGATDVEVYEAWDRSVAIDSNVVFMPEQSCTINNGCPLSMNGNETIELAELNIPAGIEVRVPDTLVVIAKIIIIAGTLNTSGTSDLCPPQPPLGGFGGGGGGGRAPGGTGGAAGDEVGFSPGGSMIDPPTALVTGCAGSAGGLGVDTNIPGGFAGSGGGGLHLIATESIEIQGQILANGGPGSGGQDSGSDGSGGGGGGAGGVIVLDSPLIRLLGGGSIVALGGGGGAGAGTNFTGAAGTGCMGGPPSNGGGGGGSGCDAPPAGGGPGTNGLSTGGGGGGGNPGYIYYHGTDGITTTGGLILPTADPAPPYSD